jgi:hypothetical protein
MDDSDADIGVTTMRLRAAKVRNGTATTAQSIMMGDISNLLTIFALSGLWLLPLFIYCT